MHLIYELRSAETLHRILKPGGVLLATFPGITRTSLSEWPGSWYWGLTSSSAKRLFGEVFQPYNVAVVSFEMPSPPALSYTVFPLKNCARRTWNIATLNMIFLITVRAQKIGLTMQSGRFEIAAENRCSWRSGGSVRLDLLYHCITPPGSDPWSLCVSPENFEGHLQAIREWGTPLPLDELVESPFRWYPSLMPSR